MKLPNKTKEMAWTRVGEAYLLLDPDTKKNVTIDPIAFMVWVQCDGKTDLESMTDVFSVDGNRDIVQAALKGILEKLEESGLVKWSK
ncbi:MAG: PqqD family protein [Candidatus Aenigmarchaeota archaeon]|nr:PqqD family protein [Candidatus Aenigmarchaeota archaeon]